MVFFEQFGGVPEWLNGTVSKTVFGLTVERGFESHPLRQELQDRVTVYYVYVLQSVSTGRLSIGSTAAPDKGFIAHYADRT